MKPTTTLRADDLPSAPHEYPPITYWHRPFTDAPDIRIPVRASLDAPFELNEPGKSPALVEACASFALGCLSETEQALYRFRPDNVGAGDRWIAMDLRLRLLLAYGDWENAVKILVSDWPWFVAAMRTGATRPRQTSICPALVAYGAGHHALALETSRFIARLDSSPANALHKVATGDAYFRRPAKAAKAIWMATVRHHHRAKTGAFLWDAGLRRMFEHFARFTPGRKSREYLYGALKGFDEVSRPYRPRELNIPTFRVMPREFVELFAYDPQLMIYVQLPETDETDRDLSRRYVDWQFAWWQEGVRLALNLFRAPGEPYVPRGVLIPIAGMQKPASPILPN